MTERITTLEDYYKRFPYPRDILDNQKLARENQKSYLDALSKNNPWLAQNIYNKTPSAGSTVHSTVDEDTRVKEIKRLAEELEQAMAKVQKEEKDVVVIQQKINELRDALDKITDSSKRQAVEQDIKKLEKALQKEKDDVAKAKNQVGTVGRFYNIAKGMGSSLLYNADQFAQALASNFTDQDH